MQSTITLLLIEDNEIISTVLSEALEVAGFELQLAYNGENAMKMLNERREDIRGIVTDIELGKGADGWEVARLARNLIPAIPVVYMSGTHQSEWTSYGVPNSTFVGKPFAPSQIVTAISALLNSSDASQR